MILSYIKKCIYLSHKSTWEIANGFFGGLLAGIGGVMFGSIYLFIGDNRAEKIYNYTITAVVYFLISCILIFIIKTIISSPFLLWKEEKIKLMEFEQNLEHPLEIIFDAKNPFRKFWSLENSKNDQNEIIGPAFWEHRIEIKNRSIKTVRNVSVTTEHIGPLPVRPTAKTFDKIKNISCDLKPLCSELVPVIRWPNPKIQAGMLANESALAYGPIKITVSADDIMPIIKVFKFDWQTEQMLWETIFPENNS